MTQQEIEALADAHGLDGGGYWEFGPKALADFANAILAAAAPGADDNSCKSCAILRRYEKTARERGYAMGKAAGNNELTQAQELLTAERRAHAETNTALTAEITRLEAQLAAAAPVAVPDRQQFAVVAVTECGAVSMTFLENALMRPGTYALYL